MKYFTIPELTASAKARALGIDNTPPPGVKIKLSTLVNNLLDPIREKWGGPITVQQRLSVPTLNKAVGGVPPASMSGEKPPILPSAARPKTTNCSK